MPASPQRSGQSEKRHPGFCPLCRWSKQQRLRRWAWARTAWGPCIRLGGDTVARDFNPSIALPSRTNLWASESSHFRPKPLSTRNSFDYHFQSAAGRLIAIAPTQSPVAQLVEQAAVNRRVVGSSPTGGADVQKAKTLAILLTPVAVSRPAGVFCFGPVFRGISPPRQPNPMFSLSQRESGLPNSTTLVRPAPQRQPRELSDSLFESAKRVNTKERASENFRVPLSPKEG